MASHASNSHSFLAEAARALAQANRILYAQGVLDAFGHVSMRHPERVDRFLISRSRAPALVEPQDICELDLEGNPSGQGKVSLYLERFIHAAIYAADPDVQAIVHSHSPAVVPFSVSYGSRLRPVCHMTGFLGSKIPLFEIREHAGKGSDLLIRDLALGTALAECRGTSAVVLMRGHGVTVTGAHLPEAVFRAVYTEKGARIQMDAERMGPCEYLNDEEMDAADEANRGQTMRAWEFWSWQLRQQGLALPPDE